MAGYMADTSYWASFCQQWKAELKNNGISSIHMRDLIPLQGEYKTLGWDNRGRDEGLAKFIRIIKENRLIGFGIGIDANHWRIIRAKQHFGSAQDFCFQRVIRRVVERVKVANIEDTVSITFDTDPEFAGIRCRRFSEIRKHDHDAGEYLSGISFVNPKDYVQMQAADLLAWETRKELAQKTGGYNSTSRFKDLFTALEDYELDYTSELWDQGELDNALSNLIRK